MSALACSTARTVAQSPITFAYEFWRFVFVQRQVALAAQSFIDFPPMQGGASFNMAAIKEQIEKAIAARSVGK